MSAETSEFSKPHTNQLRPPAPSLFVGPPSRNASSNSLHAPPLSQTSTSTRVPFLRQRTFKDESDLTAGFSARTSGSGLGPGLGDDTQQRPRGGATGKQQQQQRRTSQQRPSTEAIWAEMQNTLEEVELNGMSGANVFGAEHGRALEELRAAQVELARAWARSEVQDREDDELESFGTDEKDGEGEVGRDGSRVPRPLAEERSKKAGGSKGERNSLGTGNTAGGVGKDGKAGSLGSGKTQLEQETENDIMLARKRRLANDKYFERVSRGVTDVVARLAVVADKMGGVEMESQEIWGDRESVEGRGSTP